MRAAPACIDPFQKGRFYGRRGCAGLLDMIMSHLVTSSHGASPPLSEMPPNPPPLLGRCRDLATADSHSSTQEVKD